MRDILGGKNKGVFVAAAMIVFVGSPDTACAQQKNAGFYAGPLSAVVETIVETKKYQPGSDENSQETDEKGPKAKAGFKKKEKAGSLGVKQTEAPKDEHRENRLEPTGFAKKNIRRRPVLREGTALIE